MGFKINLSNIKGDVFGGITAGIVALPLALAFGVQSGMGPIAGLYGAIMLGIFAAIFGGTATQVSGPTGPMTVVSSSVVAAAIELEGSLSAGMGIIIGSFLLAGGFQILFGIVRIGRYIKYIPYPVLSGFMTGIGVIIFLFQVYPFMGHASPKNTIDIFLEIQSPLSAMNMSAIAIGALTIAIIYLFPKITKAIPSALVALLAATLSAYFLELDIPVIGSIPSGLPEIQFDEIYNITSGETWIILEFGLMLAALGAIDSLLTSIIADNITKTQHNSNRELIGQGIGNMASAIIGGLPGAGATMRTVVNIKAGGKTRISGFVHGVLLLAILLGLGKLAAYIPLSALAGILITVGIGIVDYKGLKHLIRVPKTDAVVLVIVLVITVFGNLLHAVGVGVLLACVLYMKQLSDIVETGSSVKALVGFQGEKPWEDEGGVYEKYKGKIYIKHLYGPLFFGFTSRFQQLIKDLDNNIEVLIIRMDKVPHIDQSGIYAMEEAILSLKDKGIKVVFAGIRPQPMDMLKKIDIIPSLIPAKHAFDSFEDCEEWLKLNMKSGNVEDLKND